MKQFLLTSLITCSVFLFTGCPPAKELTKETPPLPPPAAKKPRVAEIAVTVASVNLAKLSKRIEQKDIDEFVKTLKGEKVDVVTLQGLNRYPGVTTRIDILDELSRQAELRHAFGETIMTSGRQNGNAVLSSYPIRSNENTHYEGLRSGTFEAALQVVIDCGTRDLIFISTNLPEKASEADLATCMRQLAAFRTQYDHQTILITGNLPGAHELKTPEGFTATVSAVEDGAPRLWMSSDASITLINQRSQQTAFGAMTIAQFGLFRQSEP